MADNGARRLILVEGQMTSGNDRRFILPDSVPLPTEPIPYMSAPTGEGHDGAQLAGKLTDFRNDGGRITCVPVPPIPEDQYLGADMMHLEMEVVGPPGRELMLIWDTRLAGATVQDHILWPEFE